MPMEVEIVPNSCRPIICPRSSGSLCLRDRELIANERGRLRTATTVKPKRHSPNALTRIIYLPGECTKTIMYTLKLGGIRTDGRIPPLIRWHLVNFVNERRHVLLCRPPRTTSKASGLPPSSTLCCYQAERAEISVSLISLNTKDREYQSEPRMMPKTIRPVRRMDLYRSNKMHIRKLFVRN